MKNDVLGFARIKDKYRLALDLFDVRLMIEPEIAALACANATASQIAELKVLCDDVHTGA